MEAIDKIKRLKRRVRILLVIFISLLILSGLTAFPLENELEFLHNNSSFLPAAIQNWITDIYEAVRNTNKNYPQLSYGTDWLAFAHIVIAIAFYGPLVDPVRNKWVIQFGMIACVMIFPLAFICGPIRSIPLYWQFIDCSFGIFGLIPLYICYRKIQEIEYLQLIPINQTIN